MTTQDILSRPWRLILTDTESLDGVAPVCVDPTHPSDEDGPLTELVYDCCPQPWLECGSQSIADHVVRALNAAVPATITPPLRRVT